MGNVAVMGQITLDITGMLLMCKIICPHARIIFINNYRDQADYITE